MMRLLILAFILLAWPAAADDRVDVNTASVEELQQLPGIGPSKAKAIVEEREKNGPFASVDDLDRVRGIGASIIGKVKELDMDAVRAEIEKEEAEA